MNMDKKQALNLNSDDLKQVSGGWQATDDTDPREIWRHYKDNPIKLDLENMRRKRKGLPPITKEYIDSLNAQSS